MIKSRDIAEGTALAMRALGYTYQDASWYTGLSIPQIKLAAAQVAIEARRRGAAVEDICTVYKLGKDFVQKATADVSVILSPIDQSRKHMDIVAEKRKKQAYMRRVEILQALGFKADDVFGLLADRADGMKVYELAKDYGLTVAQVKDVLFVARNASQYPAEWPSEMA